MKVVNGKGKRHILMASNNNKPPTKQRVLVLHGGGALGAYNVGVFQALYDTLREEDEGKGEIGKSSLFDVVAGTSSGAMNAAILVSHAVEKRTWNTSVDRLKEFWNHVSTNPNIQTIRGFRKLWENLHTFNPNAASYELARKYYSTREFLFTGVRNVFSPLVPQPDIKFFDVQNTWYRYDNQPLKSSLEQFANFPIATSFKEEEGSQNQPRLLLVSVDVMEGATVTFDSYPKVDGSRKSEYGTYYPAKEKKVTGRNKGEEDGRYEYTISYNSGITLDHAIASGSVPINYDYAKIEANKLTIDKQENEKIEKVQRYFWDGGITSNTSLRELIQSHKDYWLDVKGKGKDDAIIPDLDVYIVDVWPTKEKSIPKDRDGVIDRNYDLLLSDKTPYDEKVANIVSDYIILVKDLIQLAERNNIQQAQINEILSKPTLRSKHRTEEERQNRDLVKGRFVINVKRIERVSNIDNDISSKWFDYSTDTIKQLIRDGYDDAIKMLK
jgi:NTE family protein